MGKQMLPSVTRLTVPSQRKALSSSMMISMGLRNSILHLLFVTLILQSDPGITAALNPLAPFLTTDVSIALQQQVATKKASGTSVSEAVKEVATSFLQSKGLL